MVDNPCRICRAVGISCAPRPDGALLDDPNLATLPQIAPITLCVNCQTATQIIVR